MEFLVNPNVERYINSLLKVDNVVEEMEEYAKGRGFPIIGRQGGYLLYLITKIKKPKLVVELGSGFGYSGYWFAKGITDGKVVMIDYLQENLDRAREFLGKAKLLDKVEMRVGDAVQIGREYKGIDILFLDLEKARYMEAVKSLEENLSEGGIIIADNVLFQGKVLNSKNDRKAKVLDSFNRYIHKHYDATILPVRDGLLIATKRL
ncbi:MAG: O-methyltransferase [Aquificae bacterium]|nr:O-methyltransferase [Aquificota bacterium]